MSVKPSADCLIKPIQHNFQYDCPSTEMPCPVEYSPQIEEK